MQQSKLTLLIDGNWLLISRMAIMIKEFDKDLPIESRVNAMEELKQRMAKSIILVTNRFPEIDNIILVSDGGSWRKHIPIPSQLGDVTYKGNREHKDNADWDYIYGAINAIVDNCSKIGITTSCFSNIEGDDWMWYWSRKLNDMGTNCIIWSSDNDLKQLIQVSNYTFTGWYNDKNGLWLDNTLDRSQLSDMDLFLTPDLSSPLLESLKRKTTINYINPLTIVFEKIICGDKGDNIKPIIQYTQNNKTKSISIKEWNELSNDLVIENMDDFNKNIQTIAKRVSQIKRLNKANKPIQEILEMISYNKQLVWLNEDVIPNTIIAFMNQVEYKVCDIEYIRSNYKLLSGDSNENYVKDLFESI